MLALWLSLFYFFFFFVMCFFLLLSYKIVVEWSFLNVFFSSWCVSFVVDFYSVVFASVVSLIASMIFFFSQYYMDKDTTFRGFILVLSGFVFSMYFLIFSPNLLFLLLGWDGLGLISYLLVVYYMSFSSSVAGMLTFLMNRVGDIFFLMSLSVLFMVGGFFSFYDVKGLLFMFICSVCLMLTFITKSAQIPFSSWLPAAMAAPTPVSSLVHSSTLVTAGVFLLVRFSSVFWYVLPILLSLSLFTMVMAGFMASLEWDMKKIIAFSTLSQLSFMLISFSSSLVVFCFFHLITHALFKASLFMSAGVVIHSVDSSQEFRNSSPFTLGGNLLMVAFLVCVLSLCGFPFFSGFFSKDLILDGSLFGSFMAILFLMGVLLTIFYSLRLGFYSLISFSSARASLIILYESVFYIVCPVWCLVSFAIFVGVFWWDFFYFFSFFFLVVSSVWKLFYLSLVFFMTVFMFFVVNVYKKPLVVGYFWSSMWYLNKFMTYLILKPYFKFSSGMSRTVDQGWMEYHGPQGLFNLLGVFNYSIFRFMMMSLVFFIFFFVLILGFVF